MLKEEQVRHDYRACLKLAEETDSKAMDASLRKDAEKLLNELRSICPHDEIVVLHSEYEGSRSMDYYDRHDESRICLCCSLQELSHDHFHILNKTPIARFEKNALIQVYNPLKYLLTEAKEIAETKGYKYYGKR